MNIDNLEKALLIAAFAHRGQRDKANYPYIFHPLAVMSTCETIEQKIVALLHDVVEDTDWTLDDLRDRKFPEHVVIAIDTLTRRDGETYREFIQRCSTNELAKYVKIRDLRHNLSTERMANLPKAQRESMSKKYHKALLDLGDFE